MLFCSQVQNEIGLVSTQLRNIEKKMLRTVRERSTRSLTTTGLPFLLESTSHALSTLLNDLAVARTVIDQRLLIYNQGSPLTNYNKL